MGFSQFESLSRLKRRHVRTKKEPEARYYHLIENCTNQAE